LRNKATDLVEKKGAGCAKLGNKATVGALSMGSDKGEMCSNTKTKELAVKILVHFEDWELLDGAAVKSPAN